MASNNTRAKDMTHLLPFFPLFFLLLLSFLLSVIPLTYPLSFVSKCSQFKNKIHKNTASVLANHSNPPVLSSTHH